MILSNIPSESCIILGAKNMSNTMKVVTKLKLVEYWFFENYYLRISFEIACIDGFYQLLGHLNDFLSSSCRVTETD